MVGSCQIRMKRCSVWWLMSWKVGGPDARQRLASVRWPVARYAGNSLCSPGYSQRHGSLAEVVISTKPRRVPCRAWIGDQTCCRPSQDVEWSRSPEAPAVVGFEPIQCDPGFGLIGVRERLRARLTRALMAMQAEAQAHCRDELRGACRYRYHEVATVFQGNRQLRILHAGIGLGFSWHGAI